MVLWQQQLKYPANIKPLWLTTVTREDSVGKQNVSSQIMLWWVRIYWVTYGKCCNIMMVVIANENAIKWINKLFLFVCSPSLTNCSRTISQIKIQDSSYSQYFFIWKPNTTIKSFLTLFFWAEKSYQNAWEVNTWHNC